MKAILKNKKLMTGAIAIMVGVTILLGGMTFAVWANPGTPEAATIDFENPEIKVIADPIDLWRGLVPGATAIARAEIQPSGINFDPIQFGVLIGFDFEVMVTKAAPNSVPAVSPAVTATVVPDGIIDPVTGDYEVYPLGTWLHIADDGQFNFYVWAHNEDGDVYVFVHGDNDLQFAYGVHADLYLTDNSYRGATVDLAFNYEYVQDDIYLQNLDRAVTFVASGQRPGLAPMFTKFADWIAANPGVDHFCRTDGYFKYYEDITQFFVFVDGDNGWLRPGVSPFNNGPTVEQLIADFIQTLPESGFKSLLVNATGLG
jgi:hypothetical protein